MQTANRLQAYVDDSGSHPNGELFVLAGVVSTVERWAEFSNEWRKVCGEDPQTFDFHMSRAYQLNGSYWGEGSIELLEAKRDVKLLKLISLIAKYGLIKVHSAITWKAFNSSARDRVPPEIDDPYFFLFWRVIQAVVRWQEKIGRLDRVDFVFDHQGEAGRRAAGWHRHFLDAMNEKEKFIVAERPMFSHDRDLPPLKAADICAWYLRREVIDRRNSAKRGMRYVRSPTMELLWAMPHAALHITARDLSEIIDSVERA